MHVLSLPAGDRVQHRRLQLETLQKRDRPLSSADADADAGGLPSVEAGSRLLHLFAGFSGLLLLENRHVFGAGYDDVMCCTWCLQDARWSVAAGRPA